MFDITRKLENLLLSFSGSLAFAVFSSTCWAQVQLPPDNSGLELTARAGAEDLLSLPDLSTVFFFFLLVAIVAFALWTAWGHSSLQQLLRPGGPQASNLFLGMRFRDKAQPTVDQMAYLRALDMHSAEFVSSQSLHRGDRIELLLGSLPGYPQPSAKMHADVISLKAMNGKSKGSGNDEPSAYVIKVRLNSSDPAAKSDVVQLASYLNSLTHHGQESQDYS